MESIIEILDVTKWPILIIILSLIFIKPIKELIGRITNIGKKGIEARAKSQNTQDKLLSEEKNVEHTDSDKGDINIIAKSALSIFSKETIEKAHITINKESNIPETGDSDKKYKDLFTYTTAIYIILHFERVYSLIYGSQVRLLQHLNSSFTETRESIKFYYDNAAKTYPDFYSKYNYESYMNFLFTQELIVADKENILITWLGRDFLKFIVERGLSDFKLF